MVKHMNWKVLPKLSHQAGFVKNNHKRVRIKPSFCRFEDNKLKRNRNFVWIFGQGCLWKRVSSTMPQRTLHTVILIQFFLFLCRHHQNTDQPVSRRELPAESGVWGKSVQLYKFKRAEAVMLRFFQDMINGWLLRLMGSSVPDMANTTIFLI